MKILIIESCEKIIDEQNNPSSIVHVKNSSIIANHLGCDLVSHQSQIPKALESKYDVIICAYASPYMKYNSYLEILDNNPQANLFWLVNDHDVEDNILLRKWLLKYNKKYHMICNNPRDGYRGWILRKKLNGSTLNDWIDQWHTINLNSLIFDENVFYSTLLNQNRNYDLIYYGTFRKHRVKDMLEYNSVYYYLSTSKKNHLKFSEAGIQAKFIEKLIWNQKDDDLFDHDGLRLKDYKYSIYLEDDHTHSNYAFMANRYYECVMNNTLMFFDHRCKLALDKSGYQVDPFLIVKNGEELTYKMEILNSDVESFLSAISLQQSNIPKIVFEKQQALNQIKMAINPTVA